MAAAASAECRSIHGSGGGRTAEPVLAMGVCKRKFVKEVKRSRATRFCNIFI